MLLRVHVDRWDDGCNEYSVEFPDGRFDSLLLHVVPRVVKALLKGKRRKPSQFIKGMKIELSLNPIKGGVRFKKTKFNEPADEFTYQHKDHRPIRLCSYGLFERLGHAPDNLYLKLVSWGTED